MRPVVRSAGACEALHFDALMRRLRARFDTISDARRAPQFALPEALMAGVALFALKDPSLLAFVRRPLDHNLRTVFGLSAVPSDTQMRAILDDVNPDHLRPAFTDVFDQLRDARALDAYQFEGCYLVALDGVEYFCSQKVHCPHCMTRQHTNGTVSYYHQLLGAALVHPDRSEVIALAPEPIQRTDGQTKNDCERNAARRWLSRFREDHPELPVIVIEDALSSNAPHVRDLRATKCHFLLGVKAPDHAHLFEQVCARQEQQQFQFVEDRDAQTGTRRSYLWIVDLPLNESNEDVRINFLHLHELEADGTQREWTWVTDLAVNESNVRLLARGARARWRIENETFNTLKNQGYHFEHNFGHGERNLSVVLAHLMLLAFLIDQVQQRCNPLFQAALVKKGARSAVWEGVRHLFASFEVASMAEVYQALAHGFRRPTLTDLIEPGSGPTSANDTS
jgi:Transposase DDE domain